MTSYQQASVVQRLSRWSAGTRPGAWIYARIQPGIDGLVYRRTEGRRTFSAWIAGLPVAMLTTTGAKSGQERTLPVLALADGDRLVVIASNYGRPRNPAWYHNLRAHPRVSVEIGGETRQVEAQELSGAERERYFERGVELYPGFDHYKRWAAHREIPVLALDPVADS